MSALTANRDDRPYDQDADPGAVRSTRRSRRGRHRAGTGPVFPPAATAASGGGAEPFLPEGAPVPRRQLLRGFLDPHRFVLGPVERVELHEVPSVHAVLRRLPVWLLVAALLGSSLHFALSGWTIAWPLVLVAFGYLLVVVPRRLARWKTTHYMVTNKRVMAVTGVWRRQVSSVPLDRITDVSYEQTLLEEFIGVGTVHVLSANKESNVGDLRHLPNPAAFYSFLLKLVYESKLLGPGAAAATAPAPRASALPWEETRRQVPVRRTLEF